MTFKDYIPLALKQGAHGLQNQIKLINARHFCPVCEARVNAFLPMPEGHLDALRKSGFPYHASDAETCNANAYLCPRCKASDRDRLCALFLKDYLAAFNRREIVDFGASGPLSDFIRRAIKAKEAMHYRTADLWSDNADDKVDITDMQAYKDEQFDFFICSHVLEHVPDDRKALRELYRILRPSSRAILMVPIILKIDQIDEDPGVTDESERWRRFGQFDHVRIYSKDGFLDRVREVGFDVSELGFDFFGEASFVRAGISRQSVLYILEKTQC